MPAITLGDDTTAYPGALSYLRGKIAAFKTLGNVELPALHQQAQAVWIAAAQAGDTDLTTRARAQVDTIEDAQRDWEMNNDTLQTILGPLRAVGVNLGALPAIWVIAAVVALAAAFVAIFALRDRSRTIIADLCRESVSKGQMTAAQCGNLLGATKPPPLFGAEFGIGAVLVLGIGAYFLLRRR